MRKLNKEDREKYLRLYPILFEVISQHFDERDAYTATGLNCHLLLKPLDEMKEKQDVLTYNPLPHLDLYDSYLEFFKNLDELIMNYLNSESYPDNSNEYFGFDIDDNFETKKPEIKELIKTLTTNHLRYPNY